MKIKPINFFLEGILNVRLKRLLILTICLAAIGVANLQAQTKSITGTVLDETKEPLPGVTVLIQGTTNGTMTDLDGNFSIEAKSGDVLVFTSIGMESQNITVGSSNVISLTLKESATMLTETVVIGYGSARKRDLTGSIASIKASEIANKPSSNPLASIQGKVAGVQIVNSGRAGQDPEVRIRGTNSINGYKPLYVVDGLFTDNINYLNPSDIEQMEILKDPSSLAIFGVRGANGVIIISTKRAKEGQTLVNINSSIGVKHIAKRIDLTNAAQFKELFTEQLSQQSPDKPFNFGPWQADTDWQDELYQDGLITNNTISITGSSEKNRFYLGVGYSSEDGSIKKEKFSKVTVNLNSDYYVTKNIKFGFQVNGSRTLPPDAKNVDGIVHAAPISPVYFDYKDPITGKTETMLHGLPSFQVPQVGNPMGLVDWTGDHNKSTNYRAAGNIYGEINFLKNFTFRTTYSLDYAGNDSRQFSPVIYVYNPDIPGREYTADAQAITQTKTTNVTAQSDYILTYDKKFGLHGLTATAGITTNFREMSMLNGSRREKMDDINFWVPNGDPDKWWLTSLSDASSTNQTNGDRKQWKRFTMSYLVRGLYSYNHRYLLNASYRRDGSSVFRGVGNTWDNFYSFGGGWVISEEKFMPKGGVIDYLKLKGSWGILGTENTGLDANNYYPSYPELTNVGGAVFDDKFMPIPTAKYNVTNLRWEKTHAWEVGFEMNLLKQRLRIEPVYYNKVTKDMIVMLAAQTGAVNMLENIGDVRNRGFEVSTSWNDKIGETGFTYSIGANLTTIDNEMLSYGREAGEAYVDGNGVSRTTKGMAIGYFYGYKVEGVYQNRQDIRESLPTKFTVRPGDLKFVDTDGNGEINDDDKTIIGKPSPDFTYGFNMNLGYKNFDLGVDIMGVYGNEIYRTWDQSSFAQFNYMTKRMDRWNGEGTSNWEPILDASRSVNREKSNYFIEDASFLRLRNIQLGYTFDAAMLRKVYLKGLRVYANAQNLITWSENSGYTPEIGGSAIASGIDNGSYPMPAVYTFGINITF